MIGLLLPLVRAVAGDTPGCETMGSLWVAQYQKAGEEGNEYGAGYALLQLMKEKAGALNLSLMQRVGVRTYLKIMRSVESKDKYYHVDEAKRTGEGAFDRLAALFNLDPLLRPVSPLNEPIPWPKRFAGVAAKSVRDVAWAAAGPIMYRFILDGFRHVGLKRSMAQFTRLFQERYLYVDENGSQTVRGPWRTLGIEPYIDDHRIAGQLFSPREAQRNDYRFLSLGVGKFLRPVLIAALLGANGAHPLQRAQTFFDPDHKLQTVFKVELNRKAADGKQPPLTERDAQAHRNALRYGSSLVQAAVYQSVGVDHVNLVRGIASWATKAPDPAEARDFHRHVDPPPPELED